jgi:hypothetical protein
MWAWWPWAMGSSHLNVTCMKYSWMLINAHASAAAYYKMPSSQRVLCHGPPQFNSDNLSGLTILEHSLKHTTLLTHLELPFPYIDGAVAISFGLTCKHLNLQCMSIPVHLQCHPTISASPTLQTRLEIIALVLPMSSPVLLNPTGAYLVITHCWLSWQCYYMYSHRPQYLMACYILLDPKFWYLLSPIYSGFSRS